MLGAEPRAGVRFDRDKAIADVRALSEKFRLKVDPLPPVGSIPVGQQQRVEILKALYRDARVLILDEPTAVLAPHLMGMRSDVPTEMISVVRALIILLVAWQFTVPGRKAFARLFGRKEAV